MDRQLLYEEFQVPLQLEIIDRLDVDHPNAPFFFI